VASSYVDQLLTISRRIAGGEIPAHQHNECFTAGAFDLLVVHAQGAAAFQLLTDLCARFSGERRRWRPERLLQPARTGRTPDCHNRDASGHAPGHICLPRTVERAARVVPCCLTICSGGRVRDKVPISCIGARDAQLNR
jgi:hypothetical protein